MRPSSDHISNNGVLLGLGTPYESKVPLMPLTDAKLRAAKPADKPYKLFDTNGLFVKITPSGSKLWRFRFHIDGKEKLMALGEYPRVNLVDARRRRDTALSALDEGRDPSAERREAKKLLQADRSPSFENVAREWHAARKNQWAPKYSAQILTRLEVDIFPEIGSKSIDALEPRDLLAALRKVEERGVLETTVRLKQYCSSVFRFGIAASYCRHDPAAPLQDALKTPPKAVHHKSLPRDEIGDFLLNLDRYEGAPETREALELALLTAVRTTELRAARWTEFENLEQPGSAMWRIPAVRMKMKEVHLVPLSRQAATLLIRLKKLTGEQHYLFPGPGKDGYMSNNTMLYALYRMGYHSRATTHGFRSLFSTEANEQGFNEDWIERQLAHDERDPVRGAYNTAQYLPQRRELLQWWADHLDALKSAAQKPALLSAG